MDSHLCEPATGIRRKQNRITAPRRRGLGRALGLGWGLGLLAHRPLRVLALVVAIVVMSGADLYLTLLYVTHTGMNEMNPMARAMMEYQSPGLLALWKTGTVLLSVGILIVIRRQRSAEIGAWAAFLLLGWLMGHWVMFIDQTRDFDLEVAKAMGDQDPTWIMIGTGIDPWAPTHRRVID